MKPARSPGTVICAVLLVILSLASIWVTYREKNPDTGNITPVTDDTQTIPDVPTPPVVSETVILPEPEPAPDSFTVQMGGDVLVHESVFTAAKTGDTSYDFDPYFSTFSDVFVSDLNIVNIEGPVNIYGENKSISGYPTFNMPIEILEVVKDINVNLCVTSNNHSLDVRFSGLTATLDSFRSVDLDTVGTYATEEDSQISYIVEINNIKVGVAACTTYTLGTRKEANRYCINIIGETKNKMLENAKPLVDKLKADGAEFIILSAHWGTEYEDYPSSAQQAVAKELCEYGVDVLMGSHSHCLQPIEVLEVERGGVQSKALVIYSLGNLFANQSGLGKLKTQVGMIVSAKGVRGEDGVVRLEDAFYMPTYTYVSGNKGEGYMRLMPAGMYADGIYTGTERPQFFKDDKGWKNCTSAWEHALSIVGDSIPAVAQPSAYPEGFFSGE